MCSLIHAESLHRGEKNIGAVRVLLAFDRVLSVPGGLPAIQTLRPANFRMGDNTPGHLYDGPQET